MIDFVGFPKMARLSRECIITEKIDGTNACVYIDDEGNVTAGSRTRWITPQADNFGFAKWVERNVEEIRTIGPGQHFGEWWGQGIQRGYGLAAGDKRFSLFNVGRWALHGTEPQPLGAQKLQDVLPPCIGLVPVLYRGTFSTDAVDGALLSLEAGGSYAAPGFADPEGVVVFHVAANIGFKKTLKDDESPKGLVK